MPLPPGYDVRRTALRLTRTPLGRGGFLADRVSEAAGDLDPRDAGLLRQLTLGVVRHRATLDAIGEAVSGRGRAKQDATTWELLRHGAFQMVFCDAIPDHAAVSATVALARAEVSVAASRFVNAVLRGLQRARTARCPPGAPAGDARRAVPLPEGGAVTFDRDLFPDPATQPAAWLAAAYSHPLWFAERRCAALGIEGARRVCAAGNAPPPLVLRVNRRRATPVAVRTACEAQGAAVTDGPIPEALRVGWTGDPAGLAVLADGRAVVQDATSQEAAALLAPQPGDRVLDCCAAPGGKALHCADLMGDRGTILACDRSGPGLARLRDAAARAGVTCVETRLVDAAAADLPAGGFDRVLLDAPCSNTGVLRRRVEARWRAGPEGIRELAAAQAGLLAAAARACRPGARLLYSVCSIEPEEGPFRASEAAALGLRLLEERTHLPGADDGGYLALFERRADA